MKKIRVFYKKFGRMIFVSHLDMNRYFIRLLKLSKLPIWYTEGFNKHPYLTFALPLSLGFESEYEVVDFRVTDDELSFEEIKNSLQEKAVSGIEIIKVDEPKNKPNLIAKAEYEINFCCDIDIEGLTEFLKKDEIVITKLTKKKKEKQIDISKMIFNFEFADNSLRLTLSAGATDNLNPTTVLDAFQKEADVKLPFYRVKRVMLYDCDNSQFI